MSYFDQLRRQAEANRELYPKGTKVVLDYMRDLQGPPPGTRGVVEMVDDAGTIHVHWENGSSLGLIVGEDSFHKDRG